MAELKGRHVLAITVGAFSIIIGVNLVLAVQAVRTFPGLEVANGYIASQTFDAERKAQEALGWTVTPEYRGGKLTLSVTDAEGLPAAVRRMDVLVGRATETKDDMLPDFARVAGVWEADVALARGKWMLKVEAEAPDGTKFRQRLELFVMDQVQG
ncbi:FixH family protein [Rhodobacteraceae bacterium HSP-20]|uniref:FixH family protein n=1 Tax=Paragemmobacter amnigenus TaxID=2852097 RepID=A0ABS6J0T5_9RHOB|nr:FixH family protein [Rhodobacter amnigenus]MBU9697373.1 FixH family protein [Rhodobacter amnigenus]MBV4388600.1 FixH family protein [Rhodobacter amnigenus]